LQQQSEGDRRTALGAVFGRAAIVGTTKTYVLASEAILWAGVSQKAKSLRRPSELI